MMNKIIDKSSYYHVITGDMMATIMGWLDDVKAGGGTGFIYPNREMVLQPTKGSVAFWMGLKANHVLEEQSLHGGCPVLMGQKWIVNKWIYAFEQWQKFPCLLSKKDFIPPFTGVTDFYKAGITN